MKLQRMPADGSGKVHYCQPGGVMAAMAAETEEAMISMAKQDVERAVALAEDGKVTKAELLRGIYFLSQSAKAVIDVAECRGERLATTD